MKRISFNEYDAAHLLEMSIEHLCTMREPRKGVCISCDNLYKRLTEFVGKKETNSIIQILKRNGYCTKLKKL